MKKEFDGFIRTPYTPNGSLIELSNFYTTTGQSVSEIEKNSIKNKISEGLINFIGMIL